MRVLVIHGYRRRQRAVKWTCGYQNRKGRDSDLAGSLRLVTEGSKMVICVE